MLPPLIALEEHFFSTRAPDSLKASYSEQFKHVDSVYAKLTDMGQLRRQDMDAGGVSLQVISHVPGLCSYDASACRAANDQLFSAIQAEERRAASSQKEDASDGATDHPDRKPPSSRFAGFAVLSMQQPDEAAAELRRAVTELGFVGALIDNHCGGGNRFYDGAEYESTFWAAAEELGVPVYLHPTWPGDDDSATARFRGNFSEAAAVSLGSSGFGWHADTALHVLRLFASGLFDRRPRLKVIIGHMGEMLPFMLQRIEALSRRWGDFQRDFRTVYDENIWITTSGVWSLDPMRCILANTKIDHILYSVDYPFQKNEIGLEWVRELQESGLVGDEQLRAIAYENAEKLLGVKAPSVEKGV